MKKIIKETKQKFLSEEKYIYSLSGLLILAGLGLVFWFGTSQMHKPALSEEAQNNAKDKVTVETSCTYTRILDGVCVDLESETNPRLVGVMVENHVDARPQSGISEASVVYEAPVEGNYSRFLLIFPENDDVTKVGPVRSARPYYLDWLLEYPQIMYMHVGGSPEALELIPKYGIFDLNEFYRGWYYWRSTDRYAPHNVYTSSKLWTKAWEEYGSDRIQDTDDVIQDTNNITWKFENGEACIENCVDEITVTLLAPAHEAVWKYSTSTDRYQRFQLGKPHTDQNGSGIFADTIVVQHVQTKVLDTYGRLAMETIGSGEARVYVHGREIIGTWKKETRTGRTRFYDESGDEIAFKAGKIWIEVVNQLGKVGTNVDKIQD